MSGDGSHPDLARLLEAGIALPPELTPQERRRALAAHGADSEQVDEALAMLDEEEALGGFLEGRVSERIARIGPAGEPAAEVAPSIPGFEPVRLLGRGGMGSVWLARQTGAGGRTVAIKVIRPELVAGGPGGGESAAVRRFFVEQDALARLNHPAIAQLYDAGTTADGRPFVVMEHVDGVPITEHCDRERLSVDDRLRLFAEVCHGVVHAHRRQLLHRDLKPSNVLVAPGADGGPPAVKVIDFGVARILDADAGRSASAEPTEPVVLGTPAYMSPEALEASGGDLDTRTDVYSLGVMLYELLAGSRPFTAASGSVGALLRRVHAGDPPPPSSRLKRSDEVARGSVAESRSTSPGALVRRLRGDLDAITLEAVARDREARYGSASELADDVERALAGHSVQARRPGPVERIGKLVRRHRLAAAMVALAAAAVVAGTVATSVALVRATHAERRALAEATASREVLEFLVGLLESARPDEARGPEVSVAALVRGGAERLEREDLPPLQRARLLQTLADVQLRIGEYDSARALAAEALSLREAALPEDDPAVFETLDLLGTIERRAGDLDGAAKHVERLVGLARARPGEPARLADALNTLGNLRWRQGRTGEAEAAHRQALALREDLFETSAEGGEGTDSHTAVDDLVGSLNNLGVLLWAQHRDADAEGYLLRALEVLEGAPEDRPTLRTSTLTNLGNVALRLGRPEEAERYERSALELSEAVYGPVHPTTGAALHNLGGTLAELDRLEDAEGAYRRALAVRREALGPGHPDTLQTLTNLATVLARTGRDAEAEEAYREVVARRSEASPPDPATLARALERLADVVERRGRPAEADAIRRRAAELSAPPG